MLTLYFLGQAKWTELGAAGDLGGAAAGHVLLEYRPRSGTATTQTTTARERSAVEQTFNQASATSMFAVSRWTFNTKVETSSAIDSSWAPWNGWSSCTMTCGTGASLFLNIMKTFHQARSRTRGCDQAQFGGSTSVCTTTGTETQACNTQCCRKLFVFVFSLHSSAVASFWSSWLSWTSCTRTCGSGVSCAE